MENFWVIFIDRDAIVAVYRQQPLLYSIEIWAARNSRLTQSETNRYITRCSSELAWPYLAGSSPGQLVIDIFAQHQRFAVCCQYAKFTSLSLTLLPQ